MQKIYHFDALRERYRCDAAVVWCFDNRFELGFRKFLQRIGIRYSDPIKVAGGARSLAVAEDQAGREFILDQIRQSIRLHQTTRVILMLHSDCGAYGGLEAFGGDAAAEALHHREDLRRARETVWKAFPGIQVDAYFVDFEGVWEPMLTASTAGA